MPDELARRLESLRAGGSFSHGGAGPRGLFGSAAGPDLAALAEFMSAARRRTDAALDEALPPGSQHPAVLHGAVRYAVFPGGKRLRPMLAFGAASAGGADLDRAMPVAVAAELIHTCSLVLDDLPAQDNNPLRRGQPAAHIAFDGATAMLAGSALLSAAFAQCTRLADPAASAAVGTGLADTIGSRGLIGGQIDDLAFDPSGASVEEVEHIHLRKTAALFRFSTWAGGVAAGVTGQDLDRLEAFGCAYGLAFQIADDLRDQDPRECSMLHVLSRSEATARMSDLLDHATREIEVFGPGGWVLAGLARNLAARSSREHRGAREALA